MDCFELGKGVNGSTTLFCVRVSPTHPLLALVPRKRPPSLPQLLGTPTFPCSPPPFPVPPSPLMSFLITSFNSSRLVGINRGMILILSSGSLRGMVVRERIHCLLFLPPYPLYPPLPHSIPSFSVLYSRRPQAYCTLLALLHAELVRTLLLAPCPPLFTPYILLANLLSVTYSPR